MFSSSIILITSLLAAAPADELFERIRALDDAAGFEQARASKGACDGTPDHEAAAAAERAAHIHETRIGLAREIAASFEPADQAPGPEELVPLALQATRAYERQFACEPTVARPLEAAHTLLTGLRDELRGSGSELLARKIGELDAALTAFRDAEPEGPTERPAVQIVVLDGEVTPGPADTDNNYLGRLAVRVELGMNLVRAGEPATGFDHRGLAGKLSVLARHHVSARSRVHLLFGPYYGFSRVSDPGRPDGIEWYAGGMSLHRFGGQFEVQWVPAARLERWLSINPAVEVGLEANHHEREWGYATGFQVGGGLSLCIWHQSICPGARALVSPLADNPGRPSSLSVVAVQAGLALDLLRFAEIGRARKHRKRR